MMSLPTNCSAKPEAQDPTGDDDINLGRTRLLNRPRRLVLIWALVVGACLAWLAFFVDTLILRVELNSYLQESGAVLSNRDGFIHWTDEHRAFVLELHASHDYLYPFGSLMVWGAPFVIAALLTLAVFSTWKDWAKNAIGGVWVSAAVAAAMHAAFAGDAVRAAVLLFE